MADEPTFVPGEVAEDTAVGSVYLVRRRRVFCYLRTDWSGSRALPVRQNVRIVRTREEADALCAGLCSGLIASPPDANPFLYVRKGFDGDESCWPFSPSPEYGTTEDDFAAFVQALGYELPGECEIETRRGDTVVGRDWASWWERYAPEMTDERRSELWQKFGGLYYYDFVELTLCAPPGDPLHTG
jgi:hypothetical protein